MFSESTLQPEHAQQLCMLTCAEIRNLRGWDNGAPKQKKSLYNMHIPTRPPKPQPISANQTFKSFSSAHSRSQ